MPLQFVMSLRGFLPPRPIEKTDTANSRSARRSANSGSYSFAHPQTPLYTSSYTHTMPLEIQAFDDGFILLCDNGLYFFNYSGGITSSYSFTGMNLRYADITKSGAVVVGSVNALGSENKCAVFDSTGENVYSAVLDMRISGAYGSVNYDDSLAYLTAADRVIKIHPDGTAEEYTPETEVLTVVPLNKGALLCSRSSAAPAFN